MRPAWLASASLDDIETAMMLAYEQTGRSPDRLRASTATVKSVVESLVGMAEMKSGSCDYVVINGATFDTDDTVPRGVVEVTWRQQ